MRETIRNAPLYAAMIGVPVLMMAELLSSLFYPPASAILVPLIIIGLFVFGFSAMREVYPKHAISIGTPYYFNGITKTTVEKKEPSVMKKNAKEVKLKLVRFNPSSKRMEANIYTIAVDRFTTVLDALLHIKEKEDSTLSMRYSCRMGICGSCGVVVNGKPCLACETNVLNSTGLSGIEVSPMHGNPLLKDLVNDFDDFFRRHIAVKPQLFREDKVAQYVADAEYPQTQKQVEAFLPYSYCIMCGLCLDACPVVNTNPDFIGPQALSQAQRYLADSRDQLGTERIKLVDSMEGIWGCEFAGSCSKVCPKGVDPATAIQLLKSEAVDRAIKYK